MDKQKKMLLLFGIPIFIYFILDIWNGNIFTPLFIMPVYPVVGIVFEVAGVMLGLDSRGPLHFTLRAFSFCINIFLWVLPVLLFQKAKNICLKILCCLFAMVTVAWYGFMTFLSVLFWGHEVISDSRYLSAWFVYFTIWGSAVLFYIIFAVLFYRILNDKIILPDIMKERIRKKTKHFILLVGGTIAVYLIFDICLGEIFQYILTGPLTLQTDYLVDYQHSSVVFNILTLVLRTICFTIILCLWSYPVFLFHIKNEFMIVLSFLLGVVNAAWFALWTWAAIYGWGSKFPPRDSLVVEASIRPYVFAGICLFYLTFAAVLFKLLSTKPQPAIEADESRS